MDSAHTQRLLLGTATDAAVILLLFTTLLSSWALVIAASFVLTTLLIVTWFNRNRGERSGFVLRTIAIGLAAMVIGTGAKWILQ